MLSSPQSVPASLSPETDRPSLHPVTSVAGLEAQPLWVSLCSAIEGQAPDCPHYKLSTASLCRLSPRHVIWYRETALHPVPTDT